VTGVSAASVKPKAPTPKVRAMREIMSAFAALAEQFELEEVNDFRTLMDLLDETVVRDRLLRSLTIEFLNGRELVYLVEFKLDWAKKIVVVSGSQVEEDIEADAPVSIEVDEDAAAATGKDFVKLFSKKLTLVLEYLEQRLASGDCTAAHWTVSMREERRQPAMMARIKAVEQQFGLIEPTEQELEERRLFKLSDPDVVTVEPRKIPKFFFRLFQRRQKK
jgi:hypothetical protein